MMATTDKQGWTLDALRERREEIEAIAARHGAYDVRVFGSVARGEETPQSDVDILVSAKPGTTMFDLVGLWLDLQDALSCEVDLLTDDPSGNYIMDMARREAVTL